MAVEKISAVAPKVVNRTKNIAAQQQKTHNPINSYEFHLGFIPQKNPMGMGRTITNEQVEHFIDSIV